MNLKKLNKWIIEYIDRGVYAWSWTHDRTRLPNRRKFQGIDIKRRPTWMRVHILFGKFIWFKVSIEIKETIKGVFIYENISIIYHYPKFRRRSRHQNHYVLHSILPNLQMYELIRDYLMVCWKGEARAPKAQLLRQHLVM